jgi:uncharacterized membrane protein
MQEKYSPSLNPTPKTKTSARARGGRTEQLGALTPIGGTEKSPSAVTDLERPRQERRRDTLGWLSVGLGLAGLLAPRQLARLIGADEESEATTWTLRAVGGRELACGIGLLSGAQPANWAWARLAGDVLDLALIGTALQSKDTRSDRLLIAGAGVVGAASWDAYSAWRLQRSSRDVAAEGIVVHQAVTIARDPQEVYAFFRDFQNLPRFLSHLDSVRVDNGHSHWVVRGPLGSTIEWDAEIVEDRPAELIVWRSGPNADVPTQGRVQFRRIGQDTELEIELRYDPPAGEIGATIAKLFGVAPQQQMSSDLRRLKQVLETGEVLHSDASIHPGMHAAQPSELSEQISRQITREVRS